MDLVKWILFLCWAVITEQAFARFRSAHGGSLKPQRRNSKRLELFRNARYPLKGFDRSFEKRMIQNGTSDDNEIPEDLDWKIINGKSAEPGRYPWMVALHRSDRFICSAFLVSPIYVMTAAHCVQFENGVEPAQNFFGVFGTTDRTETELRIEFTEIVAHPDFGKGESEGDVALMRLREPVETSDWVQPICLPESGRDFELEYVEAMGWGITHNEADEAAEKLKVTEMGAQPRSLCRLFFALMLISITDRHVCAVANTPTGPCFGDSGGPLVLEDMQSGRSVAIGVASFVTFLGCGRPLVPGVYTATAAFSDWVRQTAGEDSGICFV